MTSISPSGGGGLAAVVLAAGKGTRMKSALPKVLHQVCGRPLCAWPIDAALAAGAAPVVAVVGHGAEQVTARLASLYGERVRTVVQAEQKGTGHAVLQALPALQGFEGTVLLLYGDTPLLSTEALVGMLEAKARAGAALALWTTRQADPTGYGRIVRDGAGRVVRIVEHKDADEQQRLLDEVNPGMYAVDAAFLRSALTTLSPKNAAGEYYLTDLVEAAVAAGRGVVGYEVPVGLTHGVNDRVQLAEAAATLRRRIVEKAMLSGVTFVDPATAYVEAGVRFGTDVTVGPSVSLSGATAIGDGAEIGQGAVLVDTVVGEGARILPYTVTEGARVAGRAVVGPFSRLRPGAELDEESHVGNFVEIKKTRLGRGSKANHLAYLGDAEIGAGTNVGAGTITCNYDGYGKYLTRIGDGVFIGSNSTLVAPLVVGDGAYVGAGSTVTNEVPKDALALGRARQETKDGYAEKVRARAAARAGKKK